MRSRREWDSSGDLGSGGDRGGFFSDLDGGEGGNSGDGGGGE